MLFSYIYSGLQSTQLRRNLFIIKMFGRLVSEEMEVKVPASEAWKLYGTLQLAKLITKALPHLLSKVDVLHGDGSAGTILHVFFPPGGSGGVTSFKEKFVVVDDEKLVKETEVIEGGYLDLGFTLYRMRLEVMDKKESRKEDDDEWCITRATIEYDVKQEAPANAAALVSIEPLVTLMQVANHHLVQNYNPQITTTTTSSSLH